VERRSPPWRPRPHRRAEVKVLVHSNLDNGSPRGSPTCLGAQRCGDRALCVEGWSARASRADHTWRSVTRLAFQRALAPSVRRSCSVQHHRLRPSDAANYGALAELPAGRPDGTGDRPSSHAVNPVPVTEAQRIPIEEVVAAHQPGRRLKTPACCPCSTKPRRWRWCRAVGGRRSLQDARWMLDGADIRDPAQVPALRRLGAHRLVRSRASPRVLQSPRRPDGAYGRACSGRLDPAARPSAPHQHRICTA
jgi:hypothetical protein